MLASRFPVWWLPSWLDKPYAIPLIYLACGLLIAVVELVHRRRARGPVWDYVPAELIKAAWPVWRPTSNLCGED